MENSIELSPKLMGKISQDFVKVSDGIKEASYLIRKNGYTEYPIFIVSDVQIHYGSLLIAQGQCDNEKNYTASYLEIFEKSDLLSPEGAEVFKENFKNPDEFCCLFYISQEFTNFVFLPYPEDGM